jgi:GDPmannose 4,6-dehydratase
MAKKALITGITGQDGSYLAELLIDKGYEVYGFMRRTSTDPFARIEHLYESGKLKLIYGNMRDLPTIKNAVEQVVPDEVYNLAAQSHVGISFVCPDETKDINETGVERLLSEVFRVNPKARFYQASTSEMFGSTNPPQSETSPFQPVSPYAEAKLNGHKMVLEYRKKGFYAVSGFLFNHESPRRGKHFVTRKLTHSLVKVKLGLQDMVRLGNLEAKRDWGFAGDYVEAMWLLLQQETPDDFVIATGESYSVRDFVEAVGKELGIEITWKGEGLNEIGVDQNGKTVIKIEEKYFRPHEVDFLQGDSTKARTKLGWKPKVSFAQLVKMMVDSDLKLIAGRSDDQAEDD